MCRLLALTSAQPLDVASYLDAFAERCRTSKEYQGHGWGTAWLDADGWQRHRSVTPIWEDDRPALPEARHWVIHARSAFRNEGIVVENNMPFLAEDLAFAFNGELRGVRLSASGETGAARLLHLLQRFREASGGNVLEALERLDRVVTSRSAYVRALNVIAADEDRLYVHSHYSEDPEYFTLHTSVIGEGGTSTVIVTSEPLDVPGAGIWEPVPNRATFALEPASSC